MRRREPYRFLLAFAVTVLGLYVLVALQGKVQANWAAAAYPPLALATAGLLLERRAGLAAARRRAQTRLLGAAVAVALALSALGHVTDRLGLLPRLDPTTRLRGWAELGRAVGATVERDAGAAARTFLVSGRYQVASELAFYTPGRPPTYNFNLGRRLNQYDFWEGPDSRLGLGRGVRGEGRRPSSTSASAPRSSASTPRPWSRSCEGSASSACSVSSARTGSAARRVPDGPARY